MIYYIADNHFGHEKVIGYCDRKFKDVVEMNDYMLECWNSTVRKDDDIYIIGDLAFRKDTLEDYIMKLNGKKHLIIGNHDNVFIKRASYDILDKCFVEITPYKEIDDNGRLVVLFHYPIMDWKTDCQVNCDTSCKNTSIEDFQLRHLRGRLLIRNKFLTSSLLSIKAKSVFFG